MTNDEWNHGGHGGHGDNRFSIDWRVAARGFKPISIRFEFDRERMFEILGDEIYQGDPYVFLRELLQNSIDAIRMRHEVLMRAGLTPGHLGAPGKKGDSWRGYAPPNLPKL